MPPTWFLFDLGNTLIRLAYDRVIANVCAQATLSRAELIELFEQPGAYRDMERGTVTFADFYAFVRDKAGFRGSLEDFHGVWSNFFDGPVAGMEALLERIRSRYQVAFLSNSNEVHAELIPRAFPTLFRPDDRFLFSYRFKVAKPDHEMFRRAMEAIDAGPQQAVLVDDLPENVAAARSFGMAAYEFVDAQRLEQELVRDGLL